MHNADPSSSNRSGGKHALLLCVVIACCSACSPPEVKVTEVLNHGMCKTLRTGATEVEFADLAGIRGAQLLEQKPTEPISTAANSGSEVLLIAVSNGSQPTPGYAFNLAAAEQATTAAGGLEVQLQYEWITPAADAMMAQVVTSPCSVVQIDVAAQIQTVSVWLDGKQLGQADPAQRTE